MWQYEGNDTLWDMLQKRDFPYNLEPLLLGRTLDIAKSHRRRLISIRLILRQVGTPLAVPCRGGWEAGSHVWVWGVKAGRQGLCDEPCGAAAAILLELDCKPHSRGGMHTVV